MSADLDFVRIAGKFRGRGRGFDTGGSEWVSPLGYRIRCARVGGPHLFDVRKATSAAYDVIAPDGEFLSVEPSLWWATSAAMDHALGANRR